ncbi:hypothetical protein NQ318_006147 [Aromia moschata]|uniref:Neurotransmitter-gated ion-channel transmembrane domain-containing protein n=1 Tax=Aromia moschata TaxID=1265417 RepID=A0AAV8XPI4_9CUCU|nr:hypothetical protein NQ318_006147 [Aromia moschata]
MNHDHTFQTDIVIPDLFLHQLDLQLKTTAGGDINGFITNGEWDLLGKLFPQVSSPPVLVPPSQAFRESGTRSTTTAAGAVYRHHLRNYNQKAHPLLLLQPDSPLRSHRFHLAVLGFTLPPDSGEELSLGVTILLSLTVFLQHGRQTMPATSDALSTFRNPLSTVLCSW